MDKRFATPLPLVNYCLMALTVVACSILLALYFSGYFDTFKNERSVNGYTLAFTERDFTKAPFDSYDASRACQDEAKKKLGESLLRTSTDWHSTRYEPDKASFLVTLKGDVGDLYVYEEAYIYCYVDPEKFLVTYFKAYDSDMRSILDKFNFGDIVNALEEKFKR